MKTNDIESPRDSGRGGGSIVFAIEKKKTFTLKFHDING